MHLRGRFQGHPLVHDWLVEKNNHQIRLYPPLREWLPLTCGPHSFWPFFDHRLSPPHFHQRFHLFICYAYLIVWFLHPSKSFGKIKYIQVFLSDSFLPLSLSHTHTFPITQNQAHGSYTESYEPSIFLLRVSNFLSQFLNKWEESKAKEEPHHMASPEEANEEQEGGFSTNQEQLLTDPFSLSELKPSIGSHIP